MPRKKNCKSPLSSAHNEYNEALQKEESAKIQRISFEEKFVNLCVDTYRQKEVRDNLIKDGRTYCYSESKLNEIEQHFSAWNLDEVDINLAEDIYTLEIYVQERKEPLTNRIVNIFLDRDESK